MKSINNTGDYLELLHLYLTEKVGQNAIVMYEEDIKPESDQLPLIILPMVEIDNPCWSSDGRHQDDLEVSILIKIPHNLDKASVQALNIAGFIRATITDECFLDYLNEKADHVDEPEDINGQPIKWSTNERGYEISFYQTVRYGSLDELPFQLVAVELKEQAGDKVTLYEQSDN